ncbi:MAG TPA: nuclear transport factor 2 family protein [Thermomicrobiales bacterium]|nr:nuclear transport factor 2 family protein [Thermomicrobiales bacterium]
MCSNAAIATAFWRAVGNAEFDRAAAMMAPEAVVDWPLSNERMPSPGHWRDVNAHYPGRWHSEIVDIVEHDETVVTRTRVFNGGISVLAISYFTIRDDRITHLEEYWPETYAAPAWRSPWTVAIREEVAD